MKVLFFPILLNNNDLFLLASLVSMVFWLIVLFAVLFYLNTASPNEYRLSKQISTYFLNYKWRESVKRSKHFPFSDHLINSHSHSLDYVLILLRENWCWWFFGLNRPNAKIATVVHILLLIFKSALLALFLSTIFKRIPYLKQGFNLNKRILTQQPFLHWVHGLIFFTVDGKLSCWRNRQPLWTA